MGQVQSAINAGIGSIIAAKGVSEHLQSQALSNIEAQYHTAQDIGKRAVELQEESHEQEMAKEAAENVIKESNEKLQVKHPKNEKGQFVNKAEYQRKLDKDIDEAVEALRNVHKQQRATLAQKQDLSARMDMYNTRQGLIQTSINRLPAKKRPEQPDLNKILPSQERDATEAIRKEIKK